MSVAALDLLAEAHRHGIRLRATPTGTIKASAPKSPPVELAAALRLHKAELISALMETEVEDRAERAAIVEEGSGALRQWADALARLDPDHAPCDVPLKRWRLFIDDCGRFLDRRWADRAAALGWTPLNLFGCDRDRPFARLDRAGLLWLLNGHRLIALTRGSGSPHMGVDCGELRVSRAASREAGALGS